nr:DUF2806 domain-containing protein [Ramlibacter ginsenosidimutans]
MGAWYRPTGIRREAAAQADATRLLGRAELDVEKARLVEIAALQAEVERQKLLPSPNTLQERAALRLQLQEVRKQANLEAIAESAASQMPETASSEPVDEDWKTRFFKFAEDVSSADMQEIWGKVLAGEVARPGSYSLRALDVLRALSRTEAEAFQRFRYLCMDQGWVIKLARPEDHKEFGMSMHDLLALREAGLVVDSEVLSVKINVPDAPPNPDDSPLRYNGKVVVMRHRKSGSITLSLAVLQLTQVGMQLMRLVEPLPNMAYLRKLASGLLPVRLFVGNPGDTFDAFQEL